MSTRPDYFSLGEKARLIPVAAESSKEIRAVSVFLAVMTAVPAFAELMLRSIQQKVGKRAKISCFTEVAFKQTPDGKQWRPDGFILVNSGGGREWSALIEAKTGRAEIDVEQARQYATLAKTHGINSLITISNQFAALPTHSPVTLEKVTARHVQLYHWSWTFIITQAMLLINEDSLDTVEQKLILSELVRYFSHDSAGVIRFDRMNKEWKDIVLAVNARQTLLKTSREVENTVAARYQECRDICLLMTRKLNRQVVEKIPRAYADDASLRLKDGAERLSKHNVLECYLEVPDAASPIHLEADLIAVVSPYR